MAAMRAGDAGALAPARRGVFVVFEGVDRSGKSTQCRLLVESLHARGRAAELRRFPERSTAVGQIIDRYLRREIELDDKAVHLLFSANRWEAVSALRASIDAGIDVVCDRYAYSGVAFSAAKPTIDDLDWCKAPDAGLPQPDAVIFLQLANDAAEQREGFGGERYEESEMQKRVAANFAELRGDSAIWTVVDASQTIEAVQADVLRVVDEARAATEKPLEALW
ncbi:thymidylate kinase-domain-containing protein [Pelagophyceae sp. CCMP2097]|nr:thymidylate kinase-domain-containing protein [Pelagophyceae sp. CCMP2097]